MRTSKNIKKFSMLGNTGDVIKYSTYLKPDGSILNVKNETTGKYISKTYGSRLYRASKRGSQVRGSAVGHVEDVEPDIAKIDHKPGRPRKYKVKPKASQTSQNVSRWHKSVRSIGVTLGLYSNRWVYGGRKKAEAVYRKFRDVYAVPPWDVDTHNPIRRIHEVYSHPDDNVYAYFLISGSVSGDLEGEGETRDNTYVIKYASENYLYEDIEITYFDMCSLKYSLKHLEGYFYGMDAVIKAVEDNKEVTFFGIAAKEAKKN